MADLNKKILYLEDDEFTRLMVQSQLERAGFSVDSYTSFTDLNTVKEKTYDLIITDLNVDGIDARDIVINLKKLAAIPVVVLSGSEEPVEQADLIISKPLTPEKIKIISSLLPTDSSEVDLSKVYQFACGDEDLLMNYVSTFIDNYSKDLMMLKDEVAEGDVKTVKNRAHKMLSSVVYYNHKPLNALFRELDRNDGYLNNGHLQDWFSNVEKHSSDLISRIQHKVAGF